MLRAKWNKAVYLKPKDTAPDLVIDVGRYHLEMRTYLLTPAELRKKLRRLPKLK